MSCFAHQEVLLKKKNVTEESVRLLSKPIADFATKHGAAFSIGYTKDNYLFACYEIEGLTSSYCKGVVAEIKAMLQEAFHCRIEINLFMC